MNPSIKIVVPTYNAEPWIAQCLASISSQVYPDWECIVIDDASTDGTFDIIDSLALVKHDGRFRVHRNAKNVKALHNIVDGFAKLGCRDQPESILMVIDGDDWLYSPTSLATVARAYLENPELMLTYGNWIGHPDGRRSNCHPYSPETIRMRSFRSETFRASHLRTFKSKLWYAIKDEDLRDATGRYFVAGWDVAFMTPMLEMAAERHLFIQDILYCYNLSNPLSDFRLNLEEQSSAVALTESRPPYDRV